MTKICTKCNTEKDFSEFNKHKSGKDGLRSQCRECTKAEYKPKSKEASRRDVKRYCERHPERVKAKFKRWYEKNKTVMLDKRATPEYRDKQAKNVKAYILSNKEKVCEQRRIRRANKSEQEACEDRARGKAYKAIRKIKTGRNLNLYSKWLGCTIAEFKMHIESQFTDGMSWENHGNGVDKWNIDHIRPYCTFDLSKEEDVLKCLHYTNTRPLWHIKNIRRGTRKLKQKFS